MIHLKEYKQFESFEIVKTENQLKRLQSYKVIKVPDFLEGFVIEIMKQHQETDSLYNLDIKKSPKNGGHLVVFFYRKEIDLSWGGIYPDYLINLYDIHLYALEDEYYGIVINFKVNSKDNNLKQETILIDGRDNIKSAFDYVCNFYKLNYNHRGTKNI